MSDLFAVRMVNTRHHPCGCVTRFDTLYWRSVVVLPCDEHREAVAARPKEAGE